MPPRGREMALLMGRVTGQPRGRTCHHCQPLPRTGWVTTVSPRDRHGTHTSWITPVSPRDGHSTHMGWVTTYAAASGALGVHLPERRVPGGRLGHRDVLQVGHADHHAPVNGVQGRGVLGGHFLDGWPSGTQQHPV